LVAAQRTPIRPPALPGQCDGYARLTRKAVQQRVIRGYATMQGLAVHQALRARRLKPGDVRHGSPTALLPPR